MNFKTVFLFFTFLWVTGLAKRRIPLKGESLAKKSKKSTECRLGKNTYELEEKWFPDLGPPFGIMYCVRCECVPIQKKRRIKGKTRCKNIKHECPKPKCEDPVLLPGRCCKLCPGDPSFTLFNEEDLFKRENEELDDKNKNNFAALLTVLDSNGPSPAVATARFVFRKRNLYYAIYYANMAVPQSMQFVDEKGHILEELDLTASPFQTRNNRVCGVWNKVPRNYRKLIKGEELYLNIVPQLDQKLVLGGKLQKYKALSTELYTSLMAPGNDMSMGAGGTGIVSISTATDSIHINLILAGVPSALSEDHNNTLVNVVLRSDGVVVSELVRALDYQHGLLQAELGTTLENSQMRQLARGKIILEVSIKDNGSYLVKGPVMPKASCDMHSAVLSSADTADEILPHTTGSGFAVIRVTSDGTFEYTIRITNLSSPPRSITIEAASKKRRRVLDDAISVYYDGWANGTYHKTSAKDLEQLFQGDLVVNVATEKYESEIRGKIVAIRYSEAQQSDRPILLSNDTVSVAGLAWVSVDDECTFHYDISIAGFSKKSKQKLELRLNESPIREFYSPKKSRVLEKFSGTEVAGTKELLSKSTLTRLHAGVTELVVALNGPTEDTVQISSRLLNVDVQENCRTKVSGVQSPDYILDEEYDNEIPQVFKCYYEGHWFDDGEQWPAEHANCMQCTCKRSKVICDQIICPPLPCQQTVQRNGSCCNSCLNDTIENSLTSPLGSCYFEGERKHYPAGAIWHPYLPPTGFSQCVICTCKADTLTVDCQKTKCPELNCLRSEAYIPSPDACCEVCPDQPSPPILPEAIQFYEPGKQSDQGKVKTEKEILDEGGCNIKGQLYKNGDHWHPRVLPYGQMKCINCQCKDGKLQCHRIKCENVQCRADQNEVTPDGECCPLCVDVKKPKKNPQSSRNRHKENQR